MNHNYFNTTRHGKFIINTHSRNIQPGKMAIEDQKSSDMAFDNPKYANVQLGILRQSTTSLPFQKKFSSKGARRTIYDDNHQRAPDLAFEDTNVKAVATDIELISNYELDMAFLTQYSDGTPLSKNDRKQRADVQNMVNVALGLIRNEFPNGSEQVRNEIINKITDFQASLVLGYPDLASMVSSTLSNYITRYTKPEILPPSVKRESMPELESVEIKGIKEELEPIKKKVDREADEAEDKVPELKSDEEKSLDERDARRRAIFRQLKVDKLKEIFKKIGKTPRYKKKQELVDGIVEYLRDKDEIPPNLLSD